VLVLVQPPLRGLATRGAARHTVRCLRGPSICVDGAEARLLAWLRRLLLVVSHDPGPRLLHVRFSGCSMLLMLLLQLAVFAVLLRLHLLLLVLVLREQLLLLLVQLQLHGVLVLLLHGARLCVLQQ
jgi:hypothetical protein